MNKQGSIWRELEDAIKSSFVDAGSATVVMITNPSVIKRPVLVTANRTHVGFK
ncbi:MAG: ArsC/Spx/MgsR family protein [Deefgea sp.]